MADALVSSLVTAILTNLSDFLLGDSTILCGLKSQLKQLESTLTTIQAVLLDAEDKQRKSEALKNWLRKLKDAAYDADDVLDEFVIEAQRRKLPRDMKNKIRSFFSLENPLVFHAKMARKLMAITGRLDALASEKHKFHLTEGIRELQVIDSFDWRQTSSLVNELEICGRNREKEDLINLVLNSDDFSVYAICGMGGLGKTTLAQLVYNDKRVETHFELRIWVCVSDNFDVMRLTRAIMESIEGRACNYQELDPLQRCLQDKLSGRKYLLVLDDVWNEYHDKWRTLSKALSCGAKGSIVIVTTRMEKVALMMTTTVKHIHRLSNDDSWMLFEQHAFGMRDREDYVRLEGIGKDIVKKCGGVPLAVKALGSMMRFKRRESEWLAIKGSNIWDMPDDGNTILPTLKLSFDHLPPHLRQCLSFCSIFPKDYAMKKHQLIELWIANGFVSRRGQMDLHDVGCEIFNELVLRSFFEEIMEDRHGDVTCKLHDLVHDLAQSVIKYEYCFIEPTRALEVPKGVRHLVFHSSNSMLSIPRNNELLKVQSLRSFLVLPWTKCDNILPCFAKQLHLRALHLDGSTFEKWPMSISKLKQLRYLDFSHTHIKSLPESVTSLQKLQTLNIRFCDYLSELPKGMKHMKELIYLDNRDCDSLTCIPAGIGELISLRKLSMFIVGKDVGQQIGELRRLKLEGRLTIKDLDNVKDLTDARSANLILKNSLELLELIWQQGDGSKNSTEKVEETLSGLQPHSNLKKLRIIRYEGSKFPNWMMDPCLPNLVEISLTDCNRCEHLPPLGKLRLLKFLHLSGMDTVKYIGSEIYGNGESAFTSLECLGLSFMANLEEFAIVPGKNTFPNLKRFNVGFCPKLLKMPAIPSVKKLSIWGGNDSLLNSIENFPFITSLEISDFSNVTHLPVRFLVNHTLLVHLGIRLLPCLKKLPKHFNHISALKSLVLEQCYELESLPDGLLQINSLGRIRISECGIVSFPDDGFCGVASLRSLYILNCQKFSSLSEQVQYLTALEDLVVSDCLQLNSLPESIGQLTALRRLKICNCEGLSCLPNEIQYLTSLQHLRIRSCPNLMCLPEGMKNLVQLSELSITSCPNLERRCQKERGEDWPKIAHIPVIYINYQAIQYVPP